MSSAIKIPRYTGLEFELYVIKYFQNKITSCKERNIEWNLTLVDVHRLLSTKRCKYSGIPLTHTKAEGDGRTDQRFTDCTIERIDSSKPYVKENCVAVSCGFNKLKGRFETPNFPVGFKDLYKFTATLQKMGVK